MINDAQFDHWELAEIDYKDLVEHFKSIDTADGDWGPFADELRRVLGIIAGCEIQPDSFTDDIIGAAILATYEYGIDRAAVAMGADPAETQEKVLELDD